MITIIDELKDKIIDAKNCPVYLYAKTVPYVCQDDIIAQECYIEGLQDALKIVENNLK